MAEGRRMEQLPRDESLRLLGSVPIGRVVFTHLALPAIRPVCHLVEGGEIVIRTHLGAAIAANDGPHGATVVAYEADMIDPDDHVGWSVIVVGRARRLPDNGEDGHYWEALRQWASGVPDEIIAIEADIVNGFRLAKADG